MPAHRKVDPIKQCLRCGVKLIRKRFGSRLEDMTQFQQRRYCSLHCANKRGNWGNSSTAKHREAQKSVGKSCVKCGKINNLHVHHLDGNFINNLPTNLQTLCSSCHRLAHVKLAAGE